jgi:hypothetical protein
VSIAAVKGESSSANSQVAAPPAVPPEVVEACRAALAEDRAPPPDVDCAVALRTADAAPAPDAEGSLMALFGIRGVNTGAPATAQAGNSVDADNVARQLSSGDVQGSGAAAIVARERAAPPPSSPR